ncbi:MAG: membrane protein insertase [Verrucomicrobia bacterium ADurb.Bin474]|nr:MAG: membrane protein insertase [Verrucomicrobia bacterium ADurb.Bin474]
MQQKIFKFMPFMFLFILYGFSSGLVLYWTVQNVLSGVQTALVNRKKDNFVPITEGPAPTNPDGTPAARRAHGPRTTPPKRRRK